MTATPSDQRPLVNTAQRPRAAAVAPETVLAARGSRRSRRSQRLGRIVVAWLYLAPAVALFSLFVLVPLITSVQYSTYAWDGIGVAEPVGLDNYRQVFTDPALRASIAHALVLIVFFAVIPVFLGLILASAIRRVTGRFGTIARVVLFLPQILPLAASGIAWRWSYAENGILNQALRLVGLDNLARPWLGDFGTALPAVGLIGTWALQGFCLVLLLTGIGRIDPGLFEAARLDGAGPVAEFRAVILPSLRREIGVCVTITMIAALQSFDIVYVTTQGGPGTATMVPGVLIYQLAFTNSQVGLASALGVVLLVLVLLLVLPVQRLSAEKA